MRLLAVVPGTSLGGTEVQAAQRYAEYVRLGIGVHIFVLGPHGPVSGRYRTAGIPIFDSRLSLLALAARIRSGQYDVVETFGRKAGWSTRLLVPVFAREARIVSLVTSPRVPRSVVGRWIERYTGRWVSRYVSNSEAGRRAVVSIGIPLEQVEVIPNGVHWDRFQLGHEKSRARREVRAALGVPEEGWLVACVANFRVMKGHLLLLEALRRLQGHGVSAHLMLVGAGGRFESTRQRILADETLRGVVHLLGSRESIPHLLSAADVFVLASRSEGMPGSLMEAMAAELPVVATDVGGIPELVEHERTGLLVEPDSVDGLFAALRRLHADAALSNQLAASAAVAVQSFSVERQVARWLALYRELGLRPPLEETTQEVG